MSVKIEIAPSRQAEKTDKPADEGVKLIGTNDQGVSVEEACGGSGMIRRITVNGVCYAQLCCGGQWQFVYKDTTNGRIWCTCNLGQSWTVACAGANYIVPCR